MLYQVLRGDARLSEKSLFRLLQAEIAAGLRPPTDLDIHLEQYNVRKSEAFRFIPKGKSEPEIELDEQERQGIARRLKYSRKAKRLSQESLAQESGLEGTIIEQLERAELIHPTQETMEKLCDALGVTMAWLTSGFLFMSDDEVAKLKAQRRDFPALQMLSTSEIEAAYKYFEKQISLQTGALKDIFLEFAKRIRIELAYRKSVGKSDV